jgi:hypothetical protein
LLDASIALSQLLGAQHLQRPDLPQRQSSAIAESRAKRSLLGSLTMERDGDGWIKTHPWVGQRVLLHEATHCGEGFDSMSEISSVLVEGGLPIQIEYLSGRCSRRGNSGNDCGRG